MKSEDLKNSIALDDILVIPNGVDTNVFRPLDKKKCQMELGWEVNKTHILFAANDSRPEKKFHLAQEALSILNRNELVLHTLNHIEHIRIPYFMNAAVQM